MCQLVEDYANAKIQESLKDTIINFLKNGASVELIASSMPNVPRETIEKLNEQINTNM